MGSPKIALFDIETSAIQALIWGPLHDPKVMTVLKDTFMMSFAFKWAHQKKITTYALPDYPNFKKDISDDSALVRDLWAIMDEADIIIAHNGDSFDLKKSNSRFAVHGLHPPSPIKSIDPLKIARKHFKFDSNKLDNLGRYLNVGRKLPHTGAHLWKACAIDGDLKSYRLLKKYNAQDVALLERVYMKLRAWSSSHPNLSAYGTGFGCPVCTSTNIQQRGFNVAKTRKTQRLQCQDCSHWFSAPLRAADQESAARRSAGRKRAEGRTTSARPAKTRTDRGHRVRSRLPNKRLRGRG